MIQKYYKKLVSQYKYPVISYTDLQDFEKVTYGICATKRKCAGYGLSALLSQYISYNQRCQDINYWDKNPSHTVSILNPWRNEMDLYFIERVSQDIYDYCPCQTYQNFNAFIKKHVIPKLKSLHPPGNVPENAWYGTSQKTVYISPGYLPQYYSFKPTIESQITGIINECKKRCSSNVVLEDTDEEF